MPPYIDEKSNSVKLTNISADNKMDDDATGDGLRSNSSHQRLIRPETPTVQVVGGSPPLAPSQQNSPRPSKWEIIGVIILCFVNLINYMDRFTVAGILLDIQKTFKMSESQSGFLQTAFIMTYMIMAPAFGYLGDRFKRKYLMAFGVFIWTITTLIGSFMPNYWLFLLCRCFVGVGEASYSTIAPTIISDMFSNDLRSIMLAVFYFAIPVGSGLGYIIGTEMTKLGQMYHAADPVAHSEAWRWGLRATPVLGIIAVLLILLFLREPTRGASEGGNHLRATSFMTDLRKLFTNKSFVLSTLGFTCVTFVAGALAWWGPTFVELGIKVQPHSSSDVASVGFIFGVVAMTAGLLGVPIGSWMSKTLRRRFPSIDPTICATGLLLSLPCMFGAIYMTNINTTISYVIVFFGQLFLNLNWAVVSDIVLYVVIPTRRSSAEALQILFSHALGDAGSPYLIGVVSEAFRPFFNGTNATVIGSTTTAAPSSVLLTNITTTTTSAPPTPEDLYVKFKCLQYAMFVCTVVELIGAAFFFWTSFYIKKDKEIADRVIAGENEQDASAAAAEGGGGVSASTTTAALLLKDEQQQQQQQQQMQHNFADDPEQARSLIT